MNSPQIAPELTDPNFESVVLLVNAEDGIVDKSSYARTLTALGNTTTSEVYATQGTKSITYDSAADSVSYDANVAEMDFAQNDFTVEFTIRWRVDPGTDAESPMAVYHASTNDRAWFIQYVGSTPSLRCVVFSGGGSTPQESVEDSTFDPVIDTDYAIALVRNGDNLHLFVNGDLKVTTAMAADFDVWTSDKLGHISGLISPSTLAQHLTNCYMDEIRITNGVARYTASYEVSTDPFPTE